MNNFSVSGLLGAINDLKTVMSGNPVILQKTRILFSG